MSCARFSSLFIRPEGFRLNCRDASKLLSQHPSQTDPELWRSSATFCQPSYHTAERAVWNHLAVTCFHGHGHFTSLRLCNTFKSQEHKHSESKWLKPWSGFRNSSHLPGFNNNPCFSDYINLRKSCYLDSDNKIPTFLLLRLLLSDLNPFRKGPMAQVRE